MNRLLLLVLCILCCTSIELSGQTYNCTDCPIAITDVNVQTSILNVSGVATDDLGVCGLQQVCFTIQHTWIGDLVVGLESPDGLRYLVMADDDNTPSGCGLNGDNVDVCINLGTANPLTNNTTYTCNNGNPCLNGNWTVPCGGVSAPAQLGSQAPGCNLGAFNQPGNVANGNWSLIIGDVCGLDTGNLLDWSLTFSCGTVCEAEGGVLNQPNQMFCENDPSLNMNVTPTYAPGTTPDPASYSYTFVVSQGGVIQNFQSGPNLSGYPTGTYNICGISFLTSDAGQLPGFIGQTLAQLNNDLNSGSPSLCGDLSDDCFNVQINADSPPITIDTVVCQGDCVVINGTSYCTQGSTQIIFPNASNCDSTVNLNLQVLNTTAVIASPGQLDCNNSTVILDGSGSSSGAGVSYQWTGPAGCILTNPTNNSIQVNCPGVYTLEVTETGLGNGSCVVSSSVTVVQDVTPPIATATGAAITCSNPQAILDGTGSTTGAGITYQWTTVGGNIVAGANTLTPTVDQAGTYTLTVTNTNNGCVSSIDVIVIQDTTPPIAMATGGILTCAQPQIQLNGAGSSVGPNFTYQWTTAGGNIVAGATTLTPTVDQAGTYQLTVGNTTNGCTASVMVTVTVDQTPPIANAGSTGTITCIQTTLNLDGTGSSAGAGISYQWTTSDGNIVAGATTTTPTINAAGTYTITVTNATNGCTAMASVTISEDTTLPIAAGVGGFITCTNSTYTIDATSSSTGPNFTYQWTTSGGNIVSGASTLSPTVDQPGIYTLTVTNTSNGCTNMVDVMVQENTTLPTVAATGGTITCSQASIQLNGNGSSTGAQFNYQWTTMGGNIVSGATTLTPTVDAAGTYTLTVTNSLNGCVNSLSVIVTEDTTPPIAQIAPAGTITCIQNTLILDGSGSSSGPGITYQWTTAGGNIVAGATTTNPTIDAAGTYTLTVTNTNNGCTASAMVSVTEDTTSPTATASGGNLTCSQPQIQLDGTGSSTGANFTYQWTTAGGNIVSGANTLMPTVDATGTYTLTVTNSTNGCTASIDVVVGQNSNLPTATATAGVLTCTNSQITIDGTGSSTGANFTYLWTTVGGNIVSGATTLMPVVDAVGAYTLTVTDNSNGCTASFTINIMEDVTPPVAIAMGGTLDCNNTQIQLDGSGSSVGANFTYLWTTAGGNILSGATTLMPTVNATGTYTLTVSNTTNGCTASIDVVVNEDITPPIAAINMPGQLTCTINSLVLDGSPSSAGPNITYQWTTSGGNILSGATTTNPTIDATGTYTLTVTNTTNGCTATAMVTVTEDITPPIAMATGGNLSCSQPQIQLDGTGSSTGANFTYQWTTAGGNIASGANTLMPTVDATGTYTLTVTNTANGCTASIDVVVGQNSNLPTATATAGVLTCTNTQITIDGTGSSTGANFTYLWTTVGGNIISGATTLMPTVDAVGAYTLTVTDNSNGCTASFTINIMEDVTPPVATAMGGTLDCNNTQIQLDGSGSSVGANFTYLWTTVGGNILSGATTLMPTVDATGTYTLTVTNTTNGCTASIDVVVNEDITPPIAAINMPGQLTCTINSLVLDGSPSSAGPNITYQWTTSGGNIISGATTTNPTIDATGTYTLTVTNTTNGCTATAMVTVTEDITAPIAMAMGGNLSCGQPQIQLDGTGSSTGANFTYQWTTAGGNIVSGANTLMPTVDATGTYTLTVTNTANGCTASIDVVVGQNSNLPTATATAGVLTCTNTQITIDGTGSSTGANFTYLWTTVGGNIVSGATTLMPVVDAAGAYTLTVTDNSNGCTASFTINIMEDVTPPVAIAMGGTLDCNNTQIQLDGTGSSVGANFTYLWTTAGGNILSGATTLMPTVDATGTYTLTVSNTTNGCTASIDVVVNEDITPPIAAINMPGQLTCTINSLVLDGSPSSAGPNITYQWTTSGGNIVSGATTTNPTIDASGSYTLTVTNTTNGCSATAMVTVTEDITAPIAMAMGGNLSCGQPQIQLDGTGSSTGANFTYQWTTLDGNIVSGANTLMPTVDATGTYTLTVTNTTNGCTASIDVVVGQNSNLPTATATAGVLTCTNTQITIDGTGSSTGANFTYLWTTVGGNIVSGATTLMPVVDAVGAYTLTVTDNSNGCTASFTINIMEDVTPPVATAMGGTLDCNNTQIQLDGTGSSVGANFTYLWTTAGGNILSGAATLMPTVDATGTYTLTVSNTTNGCTASIDVVVNEDITPPIAAINMPGQLTCTVNTLVLDGSPSSAGPNITYQWTTSDGNILSGATTTNPTIDATGSYTLTVTNTTNGCTATAMVTVTEDITAPIAMATGGNLSCGQPQIQLDGTGSSTGANFTYQWTTAGGNIVSGANTLMPTVDATGTYTLTVTNTTNGCTASIDVVVGQNSNLPTATATAGVLTCTNTQITIDGTGSSTGANFTYLWTTVGGNIVSGATTLMPTVDAVGTYTLTVTDISNGCTASTMVVVNQDITPPLVNATGGVLTCTINQITLDGSGSATGAMINYLWTTMDGNIVSGATTLTPTVNATGTYTLTVTNTSNGCTASQSVIVGEDVVPPLAIASAPGLLTCTQTTLILDGSASSGGPTFTYNWTTLDGNIISGTNTPAPLIDAVGTYTLTVTNTSNGCTATTSVVVSEDTTPPTAMATGATLTCTQSQAILSGAGSSVGPNFTYLWTTTGGNIVSGATTLMPIVDAVGTYTLTVTNTSNGCTASINVSVTSDINAPTATAQGGTITCLNSQIQLDGTGSSTGPNITYLWTTTNGNIVSGANTLFPTVDQAGTYQLEVFDNANGCTATISVTVLLDFSPPLVSILTPDLLDCNTTQVIVDGSNSSSGPNISYQWSTVNGNIVSNTNIPVITVDAPGLYTLTVTNNDNGCFESNSVIVLEDLTPPVASAQGGTITCSNPQIVLDGSGSSAGANINYQWTTIDGNILSGATTTNPIVDQAGTYTLTVTDNDNGCTASISVSVTSDFNPPIATASGGQLTCIITQIILDGASSSGGPGFTYSWTTPDGNIVSGGNTPAPLVDQAGTYTLTVTNTNNGCSASTSVIVTEDTSTPTANVQAAGQITCTQTTLVLDGTGSSVGPNISYLWTTVGGNILSGATTLFPTINAPGNYTLTVSDNNNGCTASATVTVTQSSDLPIAVGTAPDLTCVINQVTIDGTGSSTGPNISYQWTTSDGNILSGANTLMPTVNQAGNYLLTVTDNSNGCQAIFNVQVIADDQAPTIIAITSPITCTNTAVIIDASGSTNGPGIMATWTTMDGNIVSGVNTLMPLVDQAGTYTLDLVNSNNGCQASQDFLILTDQVQPTAMASAVGPITCSQMTTGLDGSGSSVGLEFTYLWTTSNGNILSGASTLNPVVNATGTYTLTVTNNNNGCTQTAMVDVINDFTPPIVVANGATLTCTSNEVMLDGTGSDTGANFSYLWTSLDGNIVSGGTTLTPSVNTIGTYTLTVTNSVNGCSASIDVQVDQDLTAPIATASAPALTCTTNEITLDGSGSSSGAEFTYLWTTADGNILSGGMTLNPIVDQAGTYQLTVTNTINGCQSTTSVTVQVDASLPIAVADGPDLSCAIAEVLLDGTGSTTGPNISYLWTTSDGNIVSGATTLMPLVDAQGTYTLTVTNNANGCNNSTSIQIGLDDQAPFADAGPDMQLTCGQSNLSLDGSNSAGGSSLSFFWTSPDGNIVAGSSTLNPLVDAVGTYILSVTDNNNGCSAMDTVIVSQDDNAPTVIIAPPDSITCINTTVLLDATNSDSGPGFTYSWSTASGSIISGQGTLQITVEAPGVYILEIINPVNQCVGEASATVTENITLPFADAGPDQTLTCSISELILDGSNSSVGTTISYEWTTMDGNIVMGNQTLNPTVNAAGTYTLAVTDNSNGCTAFSDVVVDSDAGLPVADAGVDTLINCQQNSIQLDASASSGIGLLSFDWTTSDGNILSGADTPNPTIDAGGTYILEVTDQNNGCSNISTVLVSVDTLPPDISILEPDTLNCNQSSLIIDASNSDTGSNFDFSWSTGNGQILNGDQTPNPEVGSPGEYTLTLTNTQNGCISVASVLVNQDESLPIADAGNNQTLTCSNTTVDLNGSNSSTGISILYEWSTLDGNIVGNNDMPVIQANGPGLYTLTVTDLSNGCFATAQVEVDEDLDAPQVSAGMDTMLTCTINEIQLIGTASGNVNNFIYDWTTGNGNILGNTNTLQIMVDAAGTYELMATDTTNGCSTVSSVEVTQSNDLPAANIQTIGTLNCLSSIIQLDGTASSQGTDFEFEWQTANGNFPNGTNSLSTDIDAGGLYTLSITNTLNGCTNSTSIQIDVDTIAPDLSNNPVDALNCLVDTVSIQSMILNQGQNPSILWSTANGNILSDPSLENIQVDQSGVYLLGVTNLNNGCSETLEVEITEDVEPPMIEAGLTDTLTCMDSTLSLQGTVDAGSANFNVMWSTPDGNITGGAQTLQAEINQPGTYFILATNEENGCTNADSLIIASNTTVPIIQFNMPEIITCLQTAIIIDGINSIPSNGQFAWSTSDGNIIGATNQNTVTVDEAGEYELTLTDPANGCNTIASIMVTENTTLPTADAGPDMQLDCLDPTLLLQGAAASASGSFTVTWSTVDGNIVSGGTTLTPLVDLAGTYTLEVEDLVNGCVHTDDVVVNENDDLPNVVIQSPDELSCILEMLQLDATGSDNGPDFQNTWTTVDGTILSGQTTLTPEIGAPGTYALTILNTQTGCEQTASITVTENIEVPNITAFQNAIIPCDEVSVSVNATVNGASGNYNYLWSTLDGEILSGMLSSEITVGTGGTYTLEVTDQESGCTATEILTVEETVPISYEFSSTDPDCLNDFGSITFQNIAGGTGPYLYSIDNGQSFQTELGFDGLPPANYTLLVEDAEGCLSETAVVLLLETAEIELSIEIPEAINEGSSTQIEVLTNTLSSDIAIIQWSPTTGLSCTDCLAPTASPTETTEYELFIQDQSGCTALATVLVEVIPSADVYVPNAFSPDDDGINDIFYINAKEGIIARIPSFLIFNRWGETVFQYYNIPPNDPLYGWDGRFRGEPMNTDVFTWFAEIEYLDGRTEVIKGDVFLRR